MTVKAKLQGVYHLRHKETGKVYSGKSQDLEKQGRYQFVLLKMGKHKSPDCQALYDLTNDPSAFDFEMDVCRDQEQAKLVLKNALIKAREDKLSLNSDRFKFDEPNVGVYRIDFRNGCFYIGSSKDIRNRIATHDWQLRNDKSSNPLMGAVYRECGETYTVTILEHTDDYRAAEGRFLDVHHGSDKCLNYASNPNSPVNELWKMDAYRKRQSGILKDRWAEEGRKESYGEKMKAYWATPEAKAARSGGNNPFAKKLMVDGTEYGSFADALKQLGTSRHLLKKRIDDVEDKEAYYL